MWTPSISLLPLLLLASSLVDARSAAGDRVLVVLEPELAQGSYSRFWQSLESRGFKLTFKGPKEEQSPLTEYGEKMFDHLIMFSPSAKAFSPSLSPQSIISSLTTHQINTLFILSPSISTAQRQLAREFDIEFDPSPLISHFSHNASSPSSVLLRPSTSLPSSLPEPIIPRSTRATLAPIFYSGITHSVGANPLLIPVLHASDGAYAQPKGEQLRERPVVSGEKAGLVSALQTRGNARVGWIGGEGMLRDEVWEGKGMKEVPGNAQFFEDFTKWVFQETGVLKVISTEHHKTLEDYSRSLYTKEDDITYAITIAQHTTSPNHTSTWSPFSASDIQLEFVMLDPYVRIGVPEVGPGEGGVGTKFEVDFKVPDKHGVFKFVVDYWRPGWSFLQESSTVSVAPLRHNQFPRFIAGAIPFYTGAFSVVGMFLVFVGLWVWLGEGSVGGVKGKKKTE